MYASTEDLPTVCQLNLPTDAQSVYRTAFNRAWKRAEGSEQRYRTSQEYAWTAVRRRFQKDLESGSWMAKPTPIRTRVEPATPAAPSAFEPALAAAAV